MASKGYNPYRDMSNGQFTSGPMGFGGGIKELFGALDTGGIEKDKDGNDRPTVDFSERADYVDKKLDDWRFSKKIDTRSLYKSDNGEWFPARVRQQQELLDEIWAEKAANVPNEGKAIMAGGLGGAGKGFTLENVIGVDKTQYFTINPDDIKEAMAKKGMIPKLDKNMTPMELSPLAHEEASDLAMMLAERAYAERKNIVWDITMSSPGSVKQKRLDAMRAAGYDQIDAVFVDVSVDKSVQQARSRWENGLRRWADGKGDGGRFLPSSATGENLPTPGSPYRSKNREVFEAVKEFFDNYVVYDNENPVDDPKARKPVDSKGKVMGGGSRG